MVLILTVSLTAARAVVLLSDSFDYPDGPLVTVSAGKWTNHSGTPGELKVAAGRALVTQNNGEDVGVPLAGGPYGATTNVILYTGFTINFSNAPSGAGGYFAHFKATGTSGFCGKVFATTNGVPPGSYRVGISKSTSALASVTFLTNNLSFNTDYALVTRYAPDNGASALWVNPAAETDPAAIATDGAASVAVVAFALRESFVSLDGMGGVFVDRLVVGTSFNDIISNSPADPPYITSPPASQTVTQGANVTFTVVAGGTAPLSYQWQLDATDLAGATSSALALTNVSFAAAGNYAVTITNAAGRIHSAPATLTVLDPPGPSGHGFSVLTYNTKGFGTTDWSTNAPQVQAIGRQLMYLQPDVVTFQEIPYTNRYQMVNWVVAFLPGYSLATNSATDGLLSSVILSRFPITRSKSWLHSANLDPYGYTTNDFTRDLFEAQIAVPGFAQPLHVFTTHLKAGTSSSQDAVKRAAEASVISNYFVTGFLTTNSARPYLLTGDLNEDLAHPATGSQQPIQRLTNGTGLWLTTPVNPLSGGEQTYSIQGTLNRRYDYILPNQLLLSNMLSSQVFRTDLLASPPPPLLASDDETASDHLPVLMTFGNPYDKPFRLLGLTRSNLTVTMTWQSVLGQPYRVESSSNLTHWTVLATNLVATNSTFTYRTNLPDALSYFRVYRVP